MFSKTKSALSSLGSSSSSSFSPTRSSVFGVSPGGSPAASAHPLSLCGDCGAAGPTWAAINRGTLICADCCSVHRSLGRHVSHVKCLRQTNWIPEQLTMVQSLYSCGANSIWEYSLLNPAASSSALKGAAKKPQATDSVHPNKGDFITAKYQNLSFVYRPAKDEPAVTESDLSRQLHSSVRTPNLETSLRLLSQGADPNYYHPEKNSTPLQVAARAGQACQVELLLVYGADPGAVDKSGRTAAEYAKTSGHGGLAGRIDASQFELSDRLSFYLTGKRPDHAAGHHFLVPEFAETNDREAAAAAEAIKVAKRKMQGLNNSVFEELCVDVYDEVDRRETDQVWAATVPKNSRLVCLPFLPVNPDYGTTRNQGRQKLARLDAREFAVLVRDVLKEIRRRQTDINKLSMVGPDKMPSPLREVPGKTRTAQKVFQTKSLPVGGAGIIISRVSDDDPIYDYVASDDDYYMIPETPVSDEAKDISTSKPRPHSVQSGLTSSPSKSSSNKSRNTTAFTATPPPMPPMIGIRSSEYNELRAQLESSEAKVQRLLDSNDDMRSEITRLSTAVSKLLNENDSLKTTATTNGMMSRQSPTTSITRSNPAAAAAAYEQRRSSNASSTGAAGPTPSSASAPAGAPQRTPSNPGFSTNTPSPRTAQNAQQQQQQQQQQQHHYYDPPYDYPSSTSSSQQGNSLPPYSSPQHQQHDYADPRELPPPPPPPAPSAGTATTTAATSPLPTQEEVVRRTEAITRCIQELLISAKDEQFEAFIPCSERIVRAVTDMVILFPEENNVDEGNSNSSTSVDPAICSSLASLTAAAAHFETECRILIVRSQSEPLQQSFVTQQVIQCAFDIAKSTKQLVALFQ